MSARTLPIISGSSACWGATSAIAVSTNIPISHEVWISAEHGEPDHPHFGNVAAIYNVIDSRQSDPQNTVIEALRLLGYTEQAAHYTHFSYEMVALTPRCALELGYEIKEEDRAKSYIEVSGRKGFGVKADDLLDKLIAAAKTEVDSRHAELDDAERTRIATQIAIGALRYFMLKFTKQSVIAFDFKEALAFEGETGPYAQYAVVRASNIFRKAGVDPEQALAAEIDYARHFADTSGTEIWELWLLAGKTSFVVEQCIATTEPAFAAKHAFQLAQQFNNFYHRHHILTEADEDRKTISAGDGSRGPSRTDQGAGSDGNHCPAGDVVRALPFQILLEERQRQIPCQLRSRWIVAGTLIVEECVTGIGKRDLHRLMLGLTHSLRNLLALLAGDVLVLLSPEEQHGRGAVRGAANKVGEPSTVIGNSRLHRDRDVRHERHPASHAVTDAGDLLSRALPQEVVGCANIMLQVLRLQLPRQRNRRGNIVVLALEFRRRAVVQLRSDHHVARFGKAVRDRANVRVHPKRFLKDHQSRAPFVLCRTRVPGAHGAAVCNRQLYIIGLDIRHFLRLLDFNFAATSMDFCE